MFAAPELVEAELVEMLGQSQVALKLQGRVFADRMMGGQKGAEPNTRHQKFLARAIYAVSSYPRLPEDVAIDSCLVRVI